MRYGCDKKDMSFWETTYFVDVLRITMHKSEATISAEWRRVGYLQSIKYKFCLNFRFCASQEKSMLQT